MLDLIDCFPLNGGVEESTGNGSGGDEVDMRMVPVSGGLAPARRIYRNYLWVIMLASFLSVAWCYFTVDGYLDHLQEDYFDETAIIERFGVSMMLAEQSEELPAVERWMLGDEGVEKVRSDAIEYLLYAEGEGLLSNDGKVMLACLYASAGDDARANEIVELVSGDESFYVDALRELTAGHSLDEYSWNELQRQVRKNTRDWVACYLAARATDLHEGEEAEEMRELIGQRRQMLLVASAKVVIIDWLVFLAGLVCAVVLVRKSRAEDARLSLSQPRLHRLWPLSWVLVIFVLGDFLAEWLPMILWAVQSLVFPVVSYTIAVIVMDFVFRSAGTLLFLWFFFRRPRYVIDTLLRPVPKIWHWVLASFTLVWVLDMLWYWLSSDWFPLDQTLGYQWHEYGWEGLLISMVSGVLLAPFFEEFIFRGLLFNGLKNRFGLHAAAVVSAVIFAGVHFYGYQDLVAVGLFGLVMAYLYHLTRSLWPCILSHALFNLVITMWDWVLHRSPYELWLIK